MAATLRKRVSRRRSRHLAPSKRRCRSASGLGGVAGGLAGAAQGALGRVAGGWERLEVAGGSTCSLSGASGSDCGGIESAGADPVMGPGLAAWTCSDASVTPAQPGILKMATSRIGPGCMRVQRRGWLLDCRLWALFGCLWRRLALLGHRLNDQSGQELATATLFR
jgi:hypothetical protein